MVRETLLLDPSSLDESVSFDSKRGVHRNVSLQELMLLGARGLKLASSGEESALGTIQRSLGDIVNLCFMQWSKRAMRSSVALFKRNFQSFITTATNVSHEEWIRLHHIPLDEGESFFNTNASVSPYILAFYLTLSTALNQSLCPTDSLPPIYSLEYASAFGIDNVKTLTISSLLRRALLHQTFDGLSELLYSELVPKISGVSSTDELNKASPIALWQLRLDVDFILHCFVSNRFQFDSSPEIISSIKNRLKKVAETLSQVDPINSRYVPVDLLMEKHGHVLHSLDLFISILAIDESISTISTGSEGESSTSINLYLQPLSSSRRFNLLPVQADRSLTELQVLGKLERDQKSKSISRRLESIPGSAAANAVSSGLGFLSSMLQGKK